MSSKEQQRQDAVAKARLATQAVRAGQQRGPEGEHSEPIYTTSSYVFDSAEQAAARFAGEEEGNVYSRYTNPTVRTFEDRIAALEGGEAAVATSSGMAAILSSIMALLKSGDHLVCSKSVFGSTTVMLDKYIAKFGVEISYVDLIDLDSWRSAIRPNTKLLFLETPSNPLNEIADLEALAQIAHDNNALLAVDNCFATPALQKPLKWGADLVIHSATKYIDGQGRCVGGAVVGSAELIEEIVGFLRSAGPTMSAFNAWVFLKGLETLQLRMKAHCENTQALAEWLEQQPQIDKVYYSGLASHPQHELAKKQQSDFGSVLAFEVKGGREEAWKFIDATLICSLTANLGDAKTTIVHPASTTHGRLTEEQRLAAGIKQNLIRIAVGLEDIEDLIEDMQRGIAAL